MEDLLIEAIQKSQFNPDRVILQSFDTASLGTSLFIKETRCRLDPD